MTNLNLPALRMLGFPFPPCPPKLKSVQQDKKSSLKITLLCGLPCCGKTTLGNELAKNGTLFVDDISLKGLKSIKNNVSPLIVADVFLCREKERKAATKLLTEKGYEIEWIFFENNLEKCLQNMKTRADGRKVEGLIRLLNKEYTIPKGIISRKILTAN
jgi:predicted kinase